MLRLGRCHLQKVGAGAGARTQQQRTQTKRPTGGSSDPFHVLGVAPGTPMDEVKKKYKKLAAKYHPDMPTGDTNKFREITAAYTLLKTKGTQRNSAGGDNTAGGNAAGGEKAWDFRGGDPSAANTKPAPSQEEILWEDGRLEIICSCVAAFLFVSFIFDRKSQGTTRDHQMEKVNLSHVRPEDTNAVPQTEMDPKAIYRASEYRGDSALPTQNRYSCFQDFIFDHDTDNALYRKHTIHHFGAERVEENLVAKRCPVIIKMNTAYSGHAEYADTVVHKAIGEVNKKNWVHVDTPEAAALGLLGAAKIPQLSPSATRWLFVEHRALEDGKSAPSTCVAAILNEKFESNKGYCRRIVLTGKDDMQPLLQAGREEDIASGKLKLRSLVKGGIVPVRDAGESQAWK